MIARLVHIRRHPIKSAGGEDLGRVALTAGARLPGDREWAVLTEAGERHVPQGEPDRWLPKSCFLRGAASAPLQAVTGGWDGERLRLSHPDLAPLCADPTRQGAAILDWLRPLWPGERGAPTRLVQGAGIWTDQKAPLISILSRASLRTLEERVGQRLGLHRWRANMWLDALPPFAERDWIGRTITIGPARLRITEAVGRCAATSADTDTGRIDIDMPETLQSLYGHSDFGVFAEVVTGGQIATGDKVTL